MSALAAEAVGARDVDAQCGHVAVLEAHAAFEGEGLVGRVRGAGVVLFRDGFESGLDEVALLGGVVVVGLVDRVELLLKQLDLVVVIHGSVAVDGPLCSTPGPARSGALLAAGGVRGEGGPYVRGKRGAETVCTRSRCLAPFVGHVVLFVER